jgi:SAM-dependent methyltransferase
VATAQQTYAFRNARSGQGARLEALEALYDPGTIAQLEGVGVGVGWRCLEVGAGGGSIASYLADRVGPAGSVVALDLDLTTVQGLERPNLELVRHDIETEDPPGGPYDVIHLRMVLAWLHDAEAALTRLTRTLRPGGWLVAEELDFASLACDSSRPAEERVSFAHIAAAHLAVLSSHHSFDVAYGRRVVADLAAAGLTRVAGESRGSMWLGGDPGCTLWRLTLEQLREPMVETGLVDAAEVDDALARCSDPAFSVVSPLLMAARGRRA